MTSKGSGERFLQRPTIVWYGCDFYLSVFFLPFVSYFIFIPIYLFLFVPFMLITKLVTGRKRRPVATFYLFLLSFCLLFDLLMLCSFVVFCAFLCGSTTYVSGLCPAGCGQERSRVVRRKRLRLFALCCTAPGPVDPDCCSSVPLLLCSSLVCPSSFLVSRLCHSVTLTLKLSHSPAFVLLCFLFCWLSSSGLLGGEAVQRDALGV